MSERHTETLFGIPLLTFVLCFHDVEFEFGSMTQFNGFGCYIELDFKDNGKMRVCHPQAGEPLWEGYVIDISEFKCELSYRFLR